MLFSKKNEQKVIALIAVQSSVVRGTLVMMQPGIAPTLLHTATKNIRHHEHTDETYLLKSAASHAQTVLEDIIKELHYIALNTEGLPEKISEIHFALSSPWIRSHAWVISKKFDRETVITQKVVKDIIASERTAHFKVSSGDDVIVEEKIFDVRVNGYSVPVWEGKTALGLEIAYASSLARKKILDHLEEVCTHIVPPNKIFFHSALLLHYIGIHSLLPHKDNYGLVHVHGEVTDIVIIEKNLCTYFGSFDRGINSVIRSIAHNLHVSEAIAESMLTLYVGGRLEDIEEKRTRNIIDDISVGWAAELEKCLRTGGYDHELPNLLMTTARIHEGFFTKSLQNNYPTSKMEPVTAELFGDKIKYLPKVERLRLTGLYALALTIVK